ASCANHSVALRWMIERHPELRRQAGRVHAEIACWEAAAGNRWAAWESASVALRSRWYEPGTARAVAAATGLLRPRGLRALLHEGRPTQPCRPRLTSAVSITVPRHPTVHGCVQQCSLVGDSVWLGEETAVLAQQRQAAIVARVRSDGGVRVAD